METGCRLNNRSQNPNLDWFQDIKPVSMISLTIKKISRFGFAYRKCYHFQQTSQTTPMSLFRKQSEIAPRIMHFE